MYPSVLKVESIDDTQILIEFDNHESGILDMAPYLDFGVFKKLKDSRIFHTVHVSFDTIAWADDIDLDPRFVYEKCAKSKSCLRR